MTDQNKTPGAMVRRSTHNLKIHAGPFSDLVSGVKTGEVRKRDDRDFQVGDKVELFLVDESSGNATQSIVRTITHIQRGYGLPDDLCVLSYAPAEQTPAVGGEPVGPLCFCGLRQTKNPHPEAGVPPGYLEVGTVYDCIPCLNKSRRAWSKRANAAEGKVSDLQKRIAELEEQQAPAVGGGIPESVTDLLNAYVLGEFELEGGSPTVEAMSCKSLDDFGQDLDEDAYATGFQQALYEHGVLLLSHLALLQAEIERLTTQVRLASVSAEMTVHTAVGRAANEYLAIVMERDQLKARIAELESGLKFYADRDHYSTDDGLNWDSCSGEPMNILWHESEPWFIEDGSIARAAMSKSSNQNP